MISYCPCLQTNLPECMTAFVPKVSPELTEALGVADAGLGHLLLRLAPDQHTRLLPLAFYR